MNRNGSWGKSGPLTLTEQHWWSDLTICSGPLTSKIRSSALGRPHAAARSPGGALNSSCGFFAQLIVGQPIEIITGETKSVISPGGSSSSNSRHTCTTSHPISERRGPFSVQASTETEAFGVAGST
jgi:hypothetical protein